MVARKVQVVVLAMAMFGCTVSEYSHGGYGGGGGGDLGHGYGHSSYGGGGEHLGGGEHHHAGPHHEHGGHHLGYGQEVHYQPALAKVAVPAVEKHVVDYYSKPKYAFSYGVNDHTTGDIKVCAYHIRKRNVIQTNYHES